MKILHICTNNRGGAGKAAGRLHYGLKSIGVDSGMLLLHGDVTHDGSEDIIEFTRKRSPIKRVIDKIYSEYIIAEYGAYKKTRPHGFELFSNDRTIYDIGAHPMVKACDLVNLHWIAGMVNHSEFFSKIGSKPVVWTLHDFNPITGGCHIPVECTKYETGCGSCPQLGSNDPDDLSRRIFLRKEGAYKGREIAVVAPSGYMADCVKKSVLFKNFKIYTIPHGLPGSVFKKRDKNLSRDLLGLPRDKTLILIRPNHTIENKGFKYLLEALRIIKDRTSRPEIALVVLGPKKDPDILLKETGYPVYQPGYIQDEDMLFAAYSSCDLTVVPSLQEIFGLTCLESMACGTPVVGSKAGEMIEMIMPYKTGLLADPKDIKDLADKIEYMITRPKEREAMGEEARNTAERAYTIDAQARSYLNLYETLLKK